MSRFLSSGHAALTPYTPGEQPRDQQYTKLNTNESPFPPSPLVQAAAAGAAGSLNLYNDPACTALREAAARLLFRFPHLLRRCAAHRLSGYQLRILPRVRRPHAYPGAYHTAP